MRAAERGRAHSAETSNSLEPPADASEKRALEVASEPRDVVRVFPPGAREEDLSTGSCDGESGDNGGDE